LSIISGIIAFFCLVGYSITMPHPLFGGSETASDIYFILFCLFGGLSFILHMDNK